jgi:hypothetical protein
MRKLMGAALAAVLVAALAVGCSDDGDDEATTTTDTTTTTEDEPAGTGACDPIDPAACLLPWPNDRFTRADADTETGRRLDLPADGMPTSTAGVSIDPTEWNRSDGFAAASIAMTRVDDLDVEASGLAPVTDIGASLEGDSSLVVLAPDGGGDGGGRLAAWAELDANAEDPEDQLLLINPAAALPEGQRVVVGLRGLVRTDGSEVEPSEAFASQLAEPDAAAEATFAALEAAGVERDELDVAWSFTVASAGSTAGRLQHMWQESAEELDGGAPPFEVTSVVEQGGATKVDGTIEMPKYLQGDGGPGSVLDNDDDPDGLPSADGTMEAPFTCLVPSGASAADPSPSVIYGHGLLGSRDEVLGIGSLGAGVGLTFCALDFIGMSTADVPAIVESFEDLSGFRTVPDRLQQGHLGFLLLGRLLASEDGLATDPAFQDEDGASILDPASVTFLGASQGGILGGAPSSLTTDWQHVILAVPGMGYNLLLRRSIDFDEFAPLVEASYPDELEQSLVLDLLEQLWQRGENAGYVQHLTSDPFDGSVAKPVLLLEAFGDHQVANVSTQKLARTLGIGRRAPTLAEGRSSDDEPYWGIDELPELPFEGSGLVTWDFGTPTPPVENVPNRGGEDPHGKLSDVPEALALVLAFATEGQIIDVCGGQPCQAEG